MSHHKNADQRWAIIVEVNFSFALLDSPSCGAEYVALRSLKQNHFRSKHQRRSPQILTVQTSILTRQYLLNPCACPRGAIPCRLAKSPATYGP